MNARARNHSVVAEQWVCAWLRPQTVRVPSRESRQNSERLRTWQGHETIRPVADRSSEVGEASTCRCDTSWTREANWVKITPRAPAISNCSQELSRRIAPVTAPPDAVSKPANSMESAAQGERSCTVVLVEDPEDINGSGKGFPGSSIAVRPKASRTHWTYWETAGRSRFGMARPREHRRRPRHHTPNPKTLTAVEHRQLDP